MDKIIESVDELMNMDREELDELLCEPKYNKANLREIVRRSLSRAKEYKDAFEYEKENHKKLKDSVQKTKRSIQEELNDINVENA